MFRNLNKATTLATLALLCMSTAYATDWSSVNFDHKNSRNNVHESTLTPNNADELTLLWASDPLPGLVNVTPIVVNDVIYFGDSVGNLYAKSVNDGSDVYPSVNLGASIDGPVTVFGNTLYATSGALNLHAFNLDLTPKTAFNGGSVVIDPASVGIAQVYAGPVVVDNIVIVPTTSGGGEIYFNFFPTYHGSVNAFNATTGAFLWRSPIVGVADGAGGGAWSTASVDAELKQIFIGTTNALSPPVGDLTASLLSIDYTSGALVWSHQYTKNALWGLLYPCGKDYDVGASPNLFKIDRLFRPSKRVVGCGSKAGIYRVFERDSGYQVWAAKMIPDDQNISINGNPSAAVGDDSIFTIANYDTSGLPLGVMNMYLVMSGPVVQPQAFGQFFASFSTYDNTMIRSLDKKTGEINWSNNYVGSTPASITYANGVLYTGNFNGIFRAIKASTGGELFSDSIGAPISSPVTVVDGKAVVVTGIVGPGFSQTGGTVRVYGLAP